MIKLSHAITISIMGMGVLTIYFSDVMDELYAEINKLQERVWELEEDLNDY